MKPINLVIALPAEAKPLIDRFGLRRLMPERGFPIYANGRVHLIVSRVGKSAAAAATALLQAVTGFPRDVVWINVGIAGHDRLAIGEARLASRIIDAAGGEQWTPARVNALPLPGEPLTTLPRADFDYRRPGLYDMEAAGFFPTALRFTQPELVHCFKIVSDNDRTPARGISGHRVQQWVADQQDNLALLIEHLDEFRQRQG